MSSLFRSLFNSRRESESDSRHSSSSRQTSSRHSYSGTTDSRTMRPHSAVNRETHQSSSSSSRDRGSFALQRYLNDPGGRSRSSSGSGAHSSRGGTSIAQRTIRPDSMTSRRTHTRQSSSSRSPHPSMALQRYNDPGSRASSSRRHYYSSRDTIYPSDSVSNAAYNNNNNNTTMSRRRGSVMLSTTSRQNNNSLLSRPSSSSSRRHTSYDGHPVIVRSPRRRPSRQQQQQPQLPGPCTCPSGPDTFFIIDAGDSADVEITHRVSDSGEYFRAD
jgi:hypothetical protein